MKLGLIVTENKQMNKTRFTFWSNGKDNSWIEWDEDFICVSVLVLKTGLDEEGTFAETPGKKELSSLEEGTDYSVRVQRCC